MNNKDDKIKLAGGILTVFFEEHFKNIYSKETLAWTVCCMLNKYDISIIDLKRAMVFVGRIIKNNNGIDDYYHFKIDALGLLRDIKAVI